MPVIELPKEHHPDFAVPRRKPVGPVAVDWSNPITRGLISCIVCGVVDYDLVSGEKGTRASSVVTQVIDGEVANASSTTSANTSQFTNPKLLDVPKSNFSFFVRTHSGNNAATASNDCAVAWGGTNDLLLYVFDSSSYRMYWDTPVASGAANPTIGVWNNAAFVSLADNQHRFYMNNLVGSDRTTNISRSTKTYSHMNINGSTDFSQLGDQRAYSVLYIWERAITNAEYFEINNNFAAILKPAIPMNYFIPEAAPAVGGPVPGSLGLMGVGI